MTPIEAKDEMCGIVKAALPTDFILEFEDAVRDGSNSEPPSGVTWGRVTIRHADGGQASLTGPLEGLKRYDREGTLHFQVFTPRGDGGTAAYDVADTVAKALEQAKLPCLWFRNVRLQDITKQSGAFYQVKVLATFQYDTVR